jgi:hypothetical protein
MTTKSRRYRPAIGVAAVAIGAIVPSAAHASVAVVDDDSLDVTIVDEGDPNHRVLLGGTPTSGTMADSTTDFGTEISVSGQGFPIDVALSAAGNAARTTEVLGAETDGSFSTRETLTSFNLSTSSAGSTDPEELDLDEAVTVDFAPLVDVPFVVEHSSTGEVSVDVQAAVDMSPEERELAEELVDGGFFTGPFVAIPTVPVGQGAVWIVAESGSTSTVVPLTLRFTLVSLKGDDYTIEIGLEGDVLEDLAAGSPDTDVTGEATLTGTLTGNATNILDQQLTVDMQMDVTASEDDITLDLDAEINIDYTSAPR